LLPLGSEIEALIPVLPPSAAQEPLVGYQILLALALQPITLALVDGIDYTFLKKILPFVPAVGRAVPYWLALKTV